MTLTQLCVIKKYSPYNAAKAAVRHLCASLSVEWAKAGIRVNCISPGYMLTAL
jgi:NAD(P)-dependent dehydrogenase (short-subunit alcohol dehydrogenase family)